MSDTMASPEVKVGIEPVTQKLNGLGHKFEAVPSPDGTPNGIGRLEQPEVVSGENKYAEQRQKLRSYIERKGNILPGNHEFTQLVQRVSERLGVPEQTELMVLDTEELDAFFHPESRTVAFTRGFARYFLEQGLPLTEDHIAAVLGHELEFTQNFAN